MPFVPQTPRRVRALPPRRLAALQMEQRQMAAVTATSTPQPEAITRSPSAVSSGFGSSSPVPSNSDPGSPSPIRVPAAAADCITPPTVRTPAAILRSSGGFQTPTAVRTPSTSLRSSGGFQTPTAVRTPSSSHRSSGPFQTPSSIRRRIIKQTGSFDSPPPARPAPSTGFNMASLTSFVNDSDDEAAIAKAACQGTSTPAGPSDFETPPRTRLAPGNVSPVVIGEFSDSDDEEAIARATAAHKPTRRSCPVPPTPAAPLRNKRRSCGTPKLQKKKAKAGAANISFTGLSLSSEYQPAEGSDYMTQIFGSSRRTLGAGDFGTVCRVVSRNDGQEYAVKILKKFRGAGARFEHLKEVFHLEHLRHPNIVRIEASWEQDAQIFILTELCSCSLWDKLQSSCGPMGEASAWEALLDGMRGLNHMHSRMVLHLDVKPHNLLVSARGVVKVADLGTAFNIGKDEAADAELEGDGRYMAPEAFDDFEAAATPKRDVFSLGVSIFQMATRVILPGNGPRMGLARTKEFTAEELSACPESLRPLLFQMMENEWQQRPTFSQILQQEAVSERETARQRQLGELGINVPTETAGPISDDEWAQLTAQKGLKEAPHNNTV